MGFKGIASDNGLPQWRSRGQRGWIYPYSTRRASSCLNSISALPFSCQMDLPDGEGSGNDKKP